MSDLLGIGLSGVRAYRTALAAVGDNVANAEQPGYARRSVRLTQGMNVGSQSVIYRENLTFGGVEANSITRAWDAYRAADSRFAASADGRAGVRAQWLTSVENAFGAGDSDVGALVGAFFQAGESLASTPGDRVGRQAMLSALDNAAGAIRSTAGALARVADGIASTTQSEVDGLNADLTALEKLNLSLRQSASGGTARASLEDERDRLIDSIAERIDVSATIAKDGTAKLTLGGITSVTLLDTGVRPVISTATASDGRISMRMFVEGTTMPLPLTGGKLAGLVDVAGSTADKRRELDTIAQNLATQINGWSAAGRDAGGNPGVPLLGISGGAATLVLATNDPDAIAAASPSGASNGNLLQLYNLRTPDAAEARWVALIASNAQQLNAARSEAAATGARRDGSFAARDEVSGIDLDREAADLLRYQRAYDASAKIIQVARDTVQSILDLF
jgi:flagellar hook-associated protein 1 FlgK